MDDASDDRRSHAHRHAPADDAFARARERLAETVDVLVWKVEGLDERTVRTPLTSTGLTLLGILQHAANVVLGYLGDSFGRPWAGRPSAAHVSLAAIDADPMADWVVAADVPAAEVVSFAREVLAHVQATLDRGSDARGTVAWWSPSRADVSLGAVLDHTVADLLRHAGQADVLREACDGSVGLGRGFVRETLEGTDPSEHVARLRVIAEATGSAAVRATATGSGPAPLPAPGVVVLRAHGATEDEAPGRTRA